MAHHVYTTDAFVLESNPGREADRHFVLFTKNLGKLRASAQGVRLIKSKLRYSLQEFSHITLSVVRGKEFWRITSANIRENLYLKHKANKEVVYALAQAFRLLKRLVPDEEKNEELFEIVVQAVTFLDEMPFDKQAAKSFEYILVLQVLNNLGYLGNVPKLKKFVHETWSQELLEDMTKAHRLAITEINKSLKETQL